MDTYVISAKTANYGVFLSPLQVYEFLKGMPEKAQQLDVELWKGDRLVYRQPGHLFIIEQEVL